MKKITQIILLVLAVSTAQAQLITDKLTLTNNPVNGQLLIVNGDTRTWMDTVTTPASQIQTTNSIGWALTNLFNHVIATRFANVNPTYASSTALNFQTLKALVVTPTGWATNLYTTNSTTPTLNVEVPFTAMASTDQVTIASYLVAGLESSITLASTAAPWLANYEGLTTTQTNSGLKTFTGANVYSNAAQFFTGGGISNVALTNITYLKGSNGIYWALILVNPVMTNAQNYGAPFHSPGSGGNSEQFGISASATGSAALAVGTSAGASGVSSVALGSFAQGNADYSTAIGEGTLGNNTHSTAIGADAATTAATQVMLGTSGDYVMMPGNAQIVGTLTNLHTAGTNVFDGDIAFLRKNITTLVNSNNVVSVSTNLYVKLSGPSGPFCVASMITSGGNHDGCIRILQNSTGFTMVIANESGFDGTAANRIYTGANADVAITNNPGFAQLIYDASLSRWCVMSRSN